MGRRGLEDYLKWKARASLTLYVSAPLLFGLMLPRITVVHSGRTRTLRSPWLLRNLVVIISPVVARKRKSSSTQGSRYSPPFSAPRKLFNTFSGPRTNEQKRIV
jgi:hypothetical protein